MKRGTDVEAAGMTLRKRGRKGLARIVFSRLGLVLLLLLLQVFALVAAVAWFEEYFPHFYGGMTLLSGCMVLYLFNSRHDPSAKLTWLVIIVLLPVFGTLLYLFTRLELGCRALRKRVRTLSQKAQNAITQTKLDALAAEDPGAAAMCRYVAGSGCYPVFDHTRTTYFPSGEAKFQQMLLELEKAEHFIFLEYFIVAPGYMWGKVLEILARKASQGVEVRMLYDGTCEFSTLPGNYPKQLAALGIQCKAFAPATPFVSTYYNYRDHRKILVIDGHTAFTGGVNLADEYINRGSRFGHWKDTALMVQGNAASSFTLMFLQMWSITQRQIDWQPYLCSTPYPEENGYVMPYGDCPVDDKRVGQQVYMDILNRAKRYVYIMTPYLILDAEMENALCYAAQRGVDVAIILPGIPDKRFPYALAKTHYRALLNAGVRLYEYTPGFVHAKVFVSDDREAVVGTINLDYRSLYHHFECAAYLYNTGCIDQIRQDWLSTAQSCRAVTYEMIRKEKWTVKAAGYVLKVIAPLL